jgi:hypothetical protein
MFDGTVTQANNDAVAYDDVGNHLYFIDQTAQRLRRVPIDGYAQTGPTEEAAILTADEAAGTNGMVAHQGTVYLLVDTAVTKSIVSVTSTGTKTTVVNFFSERGAGDAAGVQSDLALRVQGLFVGLYTLDTLHDSVLVYVLAGTPAELIEVVPDATTDADAASKTGTSGERVGLAILP